MNFIKKNKENFIRFLIVLFILLLIGYIFIIIYTFFVTNNYKNKMYPNVYVSEYNISDISMNSIDKKIEDISNNVLKEKIKLVANDKEYDYELSDLGVSIDKDTLVKKLKKYHNDMSYFERIKKISLKKKTTFNYSIKYDDNTIKQVLNNIKSEVDQPGKEGNLIMDENRNLVYDKAIPSYSLTIDKSFEELVNYISKGKKNKKVTLVADINEFKDSEELKSIDTKVSTFSTNYNPYISRGKNLEVALRLMDGTIVKSGDVFSYFDTVGPYSRSGYVYYDKAIGNGVCQIATTIYNTALLGGLEIVDRHPHQFPVPYVDGGLDATVVSSGNLNLTDFKFKNTYKYPIYISAYYSRGVATVEFWSNSNAKEGKEYSTSSTSLGGRRYQTYLHTFKDGVEISVDPIAYTRYPKANSFE